MHRDAARVAREEAHATRSLSVSLSAEANSSSEDALDATDLGGAARNMVIRRTEVLPSNSSVPPLELRSLTLWAPGTCPNQLEERVMGAITAVKAGRLAEARVHAQASVTALQSAGADAVVLACTELPIALHHKTKPLKAIIFDAAYDRYRGVILLCRVFDTPLREVCTDFTFNSLLLKVEALGF